MAASDEWLVSTRARAALARLESELRVAIGVADPDTAEMALHLIARGGKRLRPALLLVATEFGVVDPEQSLRAAAAMELLHVASLYHDDVMDRAETRRGGTSANAAYGNAAATAAGTFLFARACALLASLGDEANRSAAEAVSRVCSGQLLEVENSYNLALEEADLLEILARKTAALFELPCRLGAALAYAPAECLESLVRYARHVGLAFQISDDALDLTGDTSALGKATLTDLRGGVYGFPVVLALRRGDAEAARLGELLQRSHPSEAELGDAVAILRRSGAVEDALRRAREIAAEALASLRALPAGAARDSLHQLAEFAVARAQ